MSPCMPPKASSNVLESRATSRLTATPGSSTWLRKPPCRRPRTRTSRLFRRRAPPRAPPWRLGDFPSLSTAAANHSPWAQSTCARTSNTAGERALRRTDTRALATGSGRPSGRPECPKKTGGVLLSQALASQVPSALRGLTALFGMGRGVSPSPKPPEKGERPRPPGPSKLHSATPGIKKIRQALDPLVPVSFRRHRPSRSGLSTWWSTRGLTPSRGWESSS